MGAGFFNKHFMSMSHNLKFRGLFGYVDNQKTCLMLWRCLPRRGLANVLSGRQMIAHPYSGVVKGDTHFKSIKSSNYKVRNSPSLEIMPGKHNWENWAPLCRYIIDERPKYTFLKPLQPVPRHQKIRSKYRVLVLVTYSVCAKRLTNSNFCPYYNI